MTIQEIELYNEDVVDEILSHLGEYDRRELDKTLKSLCAMITVRDKCIEDLRVKVCNASLALKNVSSIIDTPTKFEKEEEKRKEREARRFKDLINKGFDDESRIVTCRILEWDDQD